MADEGLLALDVEISGGGAAGDDEGLGFDPLAVNFQTVRLPGLEFLDYAVLKAGSEFFRLLLHSHDEIRAVHAVGEAWKILHRGRRCQLAPGEASLKNKRGEVSAGGVNGGGESGTAGADDDDILHRAAK